jgi:glycosyltransferase involved in cell wall biosynthesis
MNRPNFYPNKISVALAVYNEEENLEKCLQSVKDLTDETIVVDGGSTDKTIDIAKKFGAKIIKTENLQNFHINKNKAIDACKNEWILQLDADETVSVELKEEIKKAIANPEINGYWIPRKNFFLGRFLTKGGQYPDYTLRLYRNGKGRLPAKDVHEQAKVEGKVGYLKSDLLHIRDKNFSTYMLRFNRYTDLIASQLKEGGVRIGFFSFILYIIVKPIFWFLSSYIRHRGYVDGFSGFVFALFSSLRFPVSFIKLLSNYENSN